MKTNTWTVKLLIITAVLLAGILGFSGCADFVGVGYSDAYYVPDYRPFYADYYYDGVPYWGPDVAYIRKKVVVKDVDKHINVNRNIYYGGHHFVGAGNFVGPRPGPRGGGGGFRRVRG
jgi:hypothetical protein